jgi:hypothetical protein
VGQAVRPGRRSRRRHGKPGGSLALGELLDEYGEELFLDLKEFWGLDLVAFLSGGVLSSVPVINAYIRHLPEGSRFVARWSRDHPEGADAIELTPAQEKYFEARTWNQDRRLLAIIANAVNQNTLALGHWAKNKEPEFPVVGPVEWDPKRRKRQEIREQIQQGAVSTADILKAMGWKGGSNG